ncbi:MAG: MAE_28990/MAE_18760 family HEPN-like nuclease [Ginsengibacter sp.]
MTEPRTPSLLYDAIEKEYAWRITELSNFKNSVLLTKGKAQDGMLRAGTALLYAHWEGFVKKISDLYYEFVTYQNLKIQELNDAFVGIALRSEIELLLKSKKLSQHSKLVKILIEEKQKQAHFSSNSPIKTANLNYEVFEDVCVLIGIDPSLFSKRYRVSFDRSMELTIDEDLVKRRNNIAHGEYLVVTAEEYKDLYNTVVNGFLYNFKEIIMDAIQTRNYIRKLLK